MNFFLMTFTMNIITMFLIGITVFSGRVTGFLNSSVKPESLETQGMAATSVPRETEEMTSMPERLADALDEFQIIAELAEKQVRNGILPVEDTNKLYFKMAEALDIILEFMDEPGNAFNFLRLQGIDRIITPNINIDFLPLRSRILTLTKTLFDLAPIATKSEKGMPFKVLDSVLDIFENDENPTMKEFAIDILSAWLPGTPGAQVRVMKLKGLESFYEQMIRMKPLKVGNILSLFSKIVKEHMLLQDKKKKTKADYEVLKQYRQIGLVERLSMPLVCNGLLDLFVEVWLASEEYEDNLLPVLDLLQILKPRCHMVYKRTGKAFKLFEELLVFLRDPDRLEMFDKSDVNVTALDEFFTDFAEKVKPEPKEEL